jgi:4-carboxymuconolactone decarboxylase
VIPVVSIDAQMEEALKEVPADAPVLETLLRMQLDTQERSGLDDRTYLLVRFAALVALDASADSYLVNLSFAEEAGLRPEEIRGVLIALAPLVGGARIVSAAGRVRLAVSGA